jgi:hypothetical protein
MKHAGLSVRATIFYLVAVVGSFAFPTLCAAAEGATYLVTITDAQGAFVSRGVITLHADHTMSVIDSGQGGPTFFFTNQLGSWKRDGHGHGGLVARTLDFDFPPPRRRGTLGLYNYSFLGRRHPCDRNDHASHLSASGRSP